MNAYFIAKALKYKGASSNMPNEELSALTNTLITGYLVEIHQIHLIVMW